MEEENNKIEDLKYNMNKRAILFAFFLTGVLFTIVLLFAIIHVFLAIETSSLLPFLAYLPIIICAGLVYKNIYKMQLPKELILRTALFNSTIITMIFSIIPVVLLLNKPDLGATMIALIAILGFFGNFAIVYFGLLFCNSISLTIPDKLFKKSAFKLLPEEKIIVKAQKATTTTLIIELVCFVIVGFYMYFKGFSLIINLAITGKILIVCGFIYIIGDFIDRYFISNLILTNKRLIINRIFKHDELLLNEIENIESSRWWADLGYITVIDKNYAKLKSGAIANTEDIKNKVKEFIQSQLK